MNTTPRTLGALLTAAAARHPGQRAIVTMDASVTYAQLRDLVACFAAHLRQHGVGRGACVDIRLVRHPLLSVALALACAALGCAWTRKVADNPAVIVTHTLSDGTEPVLPGAGILEVNALWSRPPRGPRAPALADFPGYAAPTNTWTFMHSSGTTGTPKYMALDAENVLRRIQAMPWMDTPPNPVLACLFTPLAMIAIQHWLRILSLGGTVLFAELEDFQGRTRVDYVLGAPNHYVPFLEKTPLDAVPATARTNAVALTGGAPAAPAFFTRMLRHFSGVRYIYGANETSILSTHLVTDAGALADVVDVGQPIPQATVEVTGPDGTPAPAGTEGPIRIRSPWQTAGYLGDPLTTAQVFQDGWFVSGDLGRYSADGRLTITGRANDQLNIGGSKINPKSIDDAAMACPGIVDAACFGDTGTDGITRLAIAVCVSGPMEAATVASRMLDLLRTRLPANRVPRHAYVVSAVPRNETGKMVRGLLPEATRGLPAIAAPPG